MYAAATTILLLASPLRMTLTLGSSDVQQRFATAMEDYCAGVIGHVKDFCGDISPSLDDYMEIRRRGVGVAPVFALLEWVPCSFLF